MRTTSANKVRPYRDSDSGPGTKFTLINESLDSVLLMQQVNNDTFANTFNKDNCKWYELGILFNFLIKCMSSLIAN